MTAWEETTFYYRLDDGEEFFTSPDAQCVASTKQGRRCRNLVWQRGQEWWYPDLEREPNLIQFDTQEALCRAWNQLCLVHSRHADEVWLNYLEEA